MKKYLEDRGKLAPAYTEDMQIKCVEIWLTGQKLPSPLRKSLLLEAMAGHPDNCCWIPRLIKRESVRMLSFRQQLSWNKPWRHSPVSGGISASVTISPSSTDVSTWGSGLGFSAGSKVRSRPSVVVLVGVSSSCSMASCFTISSASTACPGESEPAVPGGQEWDEIRDLRMNKNVAILVVNALFWFNSFSLWQVPPNRWLHLNLNCWIKSLFLKKVFLKLHKIKVEPLMSHGLF